MNKLFKHMVRLIGGVTFAMLSLNGCGGQGSCSNCATSSSNGTLKLAISAPAQYPAGVEVTAYLTMTNTSGVDGNNLVYTVPADTNHTGVEISIDPSGAGQDCSNIPAGASCTFTALIPAGSKPGKFTVMATPNSSLLAQIIPKNKTIKLSATDSISVTANLGLVNTPTTNNQFYVLPSNQTTVGSATNSTLIYVAVWIKQASSGLNSLKLVDEAGNPLTATVIGTANYTSNSVNSYAVTIPAGKTVQHIQALSENICTELNIGSNDDTACSNDATVNLVQDGSGILSAQPNYFILSSDYESQLVVLINTGSTTIDTIQLPNFGFHLAIVAGSDTCTGATLLPAATCQFKVAYTPAVADGQFSGQISYHNGMNDATTGITIPYLGAVIQTGILTIAPSNVDLNYGNQSQEVTLTNTGQGNLTLTSLPSLPAPLYVINTTCQLNQVLTPGSSCVYLIGYTQADVQGGASLNLTYNDSVTPQSATLAVNWDVIGNFAYVVNDGGAQPNGVYKCPVAANGDLNYCNQQTVFTDGNNASDIAFASVNGVKYAYIATSNNGVAQCSLDDYGEFTTCNNNAAISALDDANGGSFGGEIYHINFGMVGGIQYAYLTDSYEYTLYTCTLSNDGTFNQCSSPLAFDNIMDASFTVESGIPYLYVNGNYCDSNSVCNSGALRFALDAATGQPITDNYTVALANTADAGAGTGYEINNALLVTNLLGNLFAFSDYSSYSAPWTSTTSLSSFSGASDGSFNPSPTSGFGIDGNTFTVRLGVANDANPYIYINLPNGSTPGVYKCDLNTTTGALTNCTAQPILNCGNPYAEAFASYLQQL